MSERPFQVIALFGIGMAVACGGTGGGVGGAGGGATTTKSVTASSASTGAGALDCSGACARQTQAGCDNINGGCAFLCMQAADRCVPEYTNWINCLGTAPLATWTCTPSGSPTTTACDPESAAYLACRSM